MGDFQLTITSRTDTSKLSIQEFNHQQTKHIVTQQLKTDSKYIFIIQKPQQQKWKIAAKDEKQIIQKQLKVLFKISQVLIQNSGNSKRTLIEHSGCPMFEVIGSHLIKKHRQLKIGDVYKIGSIKMGVLHIGTFNEELVESIQHNQNQLNPETENIKLKCIKCSDTYNSTNNPLKICCRCTSGDYSIHKNCLNSLLKSKVKSHTTVGNGNHILLKQHLQCSQCNSYYSLSQITQSIFDSPLSHYILFEDTNKFYAINCFKKDSISIGRERNSLTTASFIIDDMSVSRTHAQIFFNEAKKRFFIKDSNSKYGTLRQVDRFQIKKSAELQIGRNVFYFKRKKKVGFFEGFRMLCVPMMYEL